MLRKAGFSLVEISVVIFLISLILAFSLGFLNIRNDNDKFLETKVKIQKIIETINSFVILYKRLPCPMKFNDLSTGTESCDITFGFIPYDTLGLDNNYAYDAFGSLLEYKLATNLLNIYINTLSIPYSGNLLTIKNIEGDIITTKAAYAVLSRGSDQHIAYNREGQLTGDDSTVFSATDEVVYANANLKGSYTANIISDTGIYDNYLNYNTIEQIFSYHANGKITNSTCKLAEELFYSSKTNDDGSENSIDTLCDDGNILCKEVFTLLGLKILENCL